MESLGGKGDHPVAKAKFDREPVCLMEDRADVFYGRGSGDDPGSWVLG